MHLQEALSRDFSFEQVDQNEAFFRKLDAEAESKLGGLMGQRYFGLLDTVPVSIPQTKLIVSRDRGSGSEHVHPIVPLVCPPLIM